MATIVTGDLYEKLDGKLFELKRQIRQKEGYPFDPVQLDRALQAIIEGRFEAVVSAKSAVARSFKDLLAACKQAWVNDDFTEEHYPLEPIADDEAEHEVHEHHFDRDINGLKAFEELEKLGYRLCGPRRAMEFVAEHLDIQLDHPLIVTARWQYSRGYWCAPIFSRHCGERCLDLCSLDNDFYPNYGWLVLRKRP